MPYSGSRDNNTFFIQQYEQSRRGGNLHPAILLRQRLLQAFVQLQASQDVVDQRQRTHGVRVQRVSGSFGHQSRAARVRCGFRNGFSTTIHRDGSS